MAVVVGLGCDVYDGVEMQCVMKNRVIDTTKMVRFIVSMNRIMDSMVDYFESMHGDWKSMILMIRKMDDRLLPMMRFSNRMNGGPEQTEAAMPPPHERCR